MRRLKKPFPKFVQEQWSGNVLGSMDYAQIAVDDKVKVETSRGWEMAKVLHKARLRR